MYTQIVEGFIRFLSRPQEWTFCHYEFTKEAPKINVLLFFHRGSVFSALSSAHWALSQLDAAINYMQQDLAVAKSLGDTAGECRAHGNLGAAYFSQGSYKDALTAHRYQLVLAMKCKVSGLLISKKYFTFKDFEIGDNGYTDLHFFKVPK